MLNAFTVDVEDYFQVTAFEGQIDRRQWEQYSTRVVANTRTVLRLLARHQAKATFFVLGWVARRYPKMVAEIAQAGHQLGCHSYWHRLIYHQTPDEFRADLREARSAIEDAGGIAATAYRAPSFSIVQQTLWALDILREEGFESDSSIFPIHHDRYGIPKSCVHPHRLNTSAGEIWEFPPSVYRVVGMNVPALGGGYFRLCPAWWSAHCLREINASGRPAMFYIHPWEVDPDQPRLHGPLSARLRHRVNLRATEQKLDWLLARFKFGRMDQVLSEISAGAATAETLQPVS